MAPRRRSPEIPVLAACGGIIVFILVVVVAGSFRDRAHRHGPFPPPARVGVPQVPAGPEANPLVAMLRGSPGGDPREGTAAAILVDVSGSMREAVRDAKGGSSPKIEVARRCVQALVAQAEKHVKANPGSPVRLAIFEFSSRDRMPSVRPVLPLGPPDAASAAKALARMQADGGTPIGDAMIEAKRALDRAGVAKQHLLVVTDGQNTRGYRPGDVASAMNRLPDDERAALYFIAFDVDEKHFEAVKQEGGLVLSARNEAQLGETLDYVLTGKILVEKPLPPPGK